MGPSCGAIRFVALQEAPHPRLGVTFTRQCLPKLPRKLVRDRGGGPTDGASGDVGGQRRGSGDVGVSAGRAATFGISAGRAATLGVSAGRAATLGVSAGRASR